MARIVNDDIFRHPAIDAATEARHRWRLFADILRAVRAGCARTATPGEIDPVSRADLDAGHALAQRVDPAGGLVTDDRRDREERRIGMDDQQVAVAQTRRRHAQPHLARARLGHRDVDHRRLARADQLIGTHRSGHAFSPVISLECGKAREKL